MNKKFLPFLILFITHSAFAFTGMFPKAWEESDDGIWQVSFAEEFFYQTNNLAELVTFSCQDPNNCPPFELNSFLFPPYGINPKPQWGFEANIGYVFPSHKYDLQGNYEWVKSDSHLSHLFVDNGVMFGTAPTTLNFIPSEGGNFSADFMAADLTFGQYLTVSENIRLRLGYGVTYADIKQHGNTFANIDGTCVANPSFCTWDLDGDADIKTHYQGGGPKFTMDGQYDFNSSFALVAGGGVAAMFGRTKAELNQHSIFTIGGDLSVLETAQFSFEDNDFTIGLGLDARVGLRITPYVSNCLSANIEMGYKGDGYFNTMPNDSFEVDVTGVASAATDAAKFKGEDYFNYGPYISIGVDFM